MGTKAFLLLGLLLAIVLLISSEVSARDLAKTSSHPRKVEATKEANGVDYAKYGEFGGKPAGGGHGGYQGGRSRDPRILSGGPGGNHSCPHSLRKPPPTARSAGHNCPPADAESDVKPQN